MRVRFGFLVFLLTTVPALGGTQHILVGLDETSSFGAAGQTYSQPCNDSVLILDTSNPAHPTFGTPIPMSNSVYGPPVNLQITPDGSLGLVASSVLPVQKDGKWAMRLHIIKASAKGLSETSTMTLPGHPASLRGPAF